FFAGLWEQWRPRESPGAVATEPPLRSCAIITTAANSTVAPLHDRMPAILTPDAAREWLNPQTEAQVLSSLLLPAPNGWLALHPVSPTVNRAGEEGAHLIAAVSPPPPSSQLDLF